MGTFRFIFLAVPQPIESNPPPWRMFGDCLLVLALLVSVAVVAGVVVAIRLFIGTKRDRSLLSWMLATLLIGLWGGVLLGVVRYPDAQLRYRLSRDMWRFQTVAEAILAAGKIPPSAKTTIGEIRSQTVDTDRFLSQFVPYKRSSMLHDVRHIWTLEDGALLFTIHPSGVALEFHPRGTQPSQRFAKPKHEFDAIGVPEFEELGDGWFLVKRDQP
jgi:hypothetical protein